MTATEEFIDKLMGLKVGALGLLRTHADLDLDESVEGFDLFAGLWWPLRQKNERAPRREVAWLITKLYACHPVPHSPDNTFAHRMRCCQPGEAVGSKRFRQKFDEILLSPLSSIEPSLRWATGVIDASGRGLDWVKLTDSLSKWERIETRLEWAEDYMRIEKGNHHVD